MPQYRPFEQAREYVHSLDLKTTQEWLRYRNAGKLPADIPAMPQMVYDGWWISFGDWLGLERESRFASFEEARAFFQGLKLPMLRRGRRMRSRATGRQTFRATPTTMNGMAGSIGSAKRPIPRRRRPPNPTSV